MRLDGDDWRTAVMRGAVEGPRVRGPLLWYWFECATRSPDKLALEYFARQAAARRRLMTLLRDNRGHGARYRLALEGVGITPAGYEVPRSTAR